MAAIADANGLGFEVIKQYPGHVQAARKVKVKVPGKHFPYLPAAEQKEYFCVLGHGGRGGGTSQIYTASEGVGRRAYRQRHPVHLHRPGPAREPIGPMSREVCGCLGLHRTAFVTPL